MRFQVLLCWGLMVWGFTLPVMAQESEPSAIDAVEAHNQKGVEHYKAGRYPEAIREMLAAYRLIPDAALLFNIGRIYQKMGERELAVQYYQKFVASEDADPDNVQTALEHMQKLRKAPEPKEVPSVLVEDKPVAEKQVQELKEDEPAEKIEPEKDLSEPPMKEPIQEPPSVAPAPKQMSPLVWFLGGVGALALGTGGVTSFLALQSQEEFSSSFELEKKRAARESALGWALASDVGFGVGLGGLAGAFIFHALDDSSPPVEPGS